MISPHELVQADGTSPDTQSPFEIVPWGPTYYRLKLKDGLTLNRSDYQDGTFTFHLKATDFGTPGLSRVEDITVRVTDHDEAPNSIQFFGASELSEGAPAGGFVGYLYEPIRTAIPLPTFPSRAETILSSLSKITPLAFGSLSSKRA